MSEQTIAPCPKCGEPGVSEDYLFVGCSDIDCTLPEMMMQDWNRLSRASTLLRAVEGIGYESLDYTDMHNGDTYVRYCYTNDGWRGEIWHDGDDEGLIVACGIGDTAPDALIALAVQIGDRDAE